MIISIVLAALILLGVATLAVEPATKWLQLALTLTALFMLCVAGAETMALSRLRRSILRAREGLLDPVPTAGLGWTGCGRATADFNITMHALQVMFRSVEECQGRFLMQRNKMNTLLQSLPAALLSLSEDLHISLANKPAEELFDTPDRRPVIGANLFDVLQLGEHDRELLRDAFLYKQPVQNQEISLVTASGTRHYSLNLGFYSDEDNDLGGVLILQDISEHRRLQDGLAMREKLVAMGQLAAGVAHELNTPLGSILGYAQLLGRAEETEKQAEYARIIGEETKRCSRIVQDLLNFAREDRCTGETCEINQLIRDLIETFLNCRMKRYKIDVQLHLPDAPILVEGSCGQLDIVISNLIINAIHALDGVADPCIVVSSGLDDRYATISVADNGPGVPADIRSRIFDPFFTTKTVGKGSGLGLPISHAILSKRGGFIVYDDDHSHGARFLIRLPVVDTRRAGLHTH